MTGGLIESTCLVGTRDQLLERLHELGAAGLDQIMLLPALEPRYSVLERLASIGKRPGDRCLSASLGGNSPSSPGSR